MTQSRTYRIELSATAHLRGVAAPDQSFLATPVRELIAVLFPHLSPLRKERLRKWVLQSEKWFECDYEEMTDTQSILNLLPLSSSAEKRRPGRPRKKKSGEGAVPRGWEDGTSLEEYLQTASVDTLSAWDTPVTSLPEDMPWEQYLAHQPTLTRDLEEIEQRQTSYERRLVPSNVASSGAYRVTVKKQKERST